MTSAIYICSNSSQITANSRPLRLAIVFLHPFSIVFCVSLNKKSQVISFMYGLLEFALFEQCNVVIAVRLSRGLESGSIKSSFKRTSIYSLVVLVPLNFHHP